MQQFNVSVCISKGPEGQLSCHSELSDEFLKQPLITKLHVLRAVSENLHQVAIVGEGNTSSEFEGEIHAKVLIVPNQIGLDIDLSRTLKRRESQEIKACLLAAEKYLQSVIGVMVETQISELNNGDISE
ncbi:hypothetical protein [Alteromonas stellipolaris]|uniref:hypothetical protein n=1 Tax=Alteromonas stellipolaris TaxID=233316 RepID=UPI001DD4F2B3|nr:hypothetical protein [Alteromonas stellipolaris]MBZ2164170.1 hypothetical protein [Alteromonas stellipolaris]